MGTFVRHLSNKMYLRIYHYLLQEAVDIFLKVEDFWKKHPVEEADDDTPQHAPKGTPKDTPINTSSHSSDDTPKGTPKGTPTPRGTPRGTPGGTPKSTAKGVRGATKQTPTAK